jgi:hypothetical protein
MKKSYWPVILLCSIAFIIGGAEVYKWVDENGVVHFTDKPPRAQPSTEVEVQDDDHTGEAIPGESVYRNLIEQQSARRELRAQQKEQDVTERKARQAEQSKSVANCSRAIHYLNTLKRQCPIFYDGAGILRAQCPGYFYSFYEGDRTYIEDNEREELIEHYSRIVSRP